MTEFERLLAAYRGGRMDLEAMQADVDRLVARSNGTTTDALVALEAARADGLQEAAYRALRRQLTAVSENSPTVLGAPKGAPLDDSTTAMYRGLGEPEGPTELNPAAGYSEQEVARRREQMDEAPPERPAVARAERPDTTITDMGAAASGEEPTGTMWPGLYGDDIPEREFQQGEILRGRFRLVSKLGEGGMGAVWKGKDLLKEEAKDRNPYVAIKLLQADFKRHPEAFIALQRETSKQQRLAHPNIATVYDFDRDERTQTVFMSMEVMEGQPLDAFIRALPPGGLPVDEAMRIIEQLAAGLAYAHANGLVHSDLKPGNCFITSDGTVKLLDFGIARASKSKSDAEGETTLFDPAELGALTPTYATLEMFEGEDPDPRDDIFALAILAYQLFTGRHPYGKKSAPKAKALGLRPARIGKLSNRQNRALAKGLALERDRRTATVEAFLNDIRRRHSTATYVVTGAVAGSLLIAVLAYRPVTDFHNRRQHETVIVALERPGIQNIRDALASAATLGDAGLQKIMQDDRTKHAFIAHIGLTGGDRLDQWLELVRTLPVDLQRDILDDERARSSIVDDFERRIFAAFDPVRRRFDFAIAHQHVSTLETLYPDLAAALKIRNELESRRDNALDRLGDRFNRYLDAGLLTPEDGREYIGDVLDAVRRMNPTHHLLFDDRLRLRYGELTDVARRTGDYERAAALVRAGLAYAPDDPALRDLEYQINFELTRIANRQRVADIEARLASDLPERASMSDYEAHRRDLVELAEIAPDSPTLARARTRLATAMSAELDRLFDAENYDAAWRLVLEHAPLLELQYLQAARERLPWEASLAARRDDIRIDAHIDAIDELLSQPHEQNANQAVLEQEYKQLVLLLPAGHAAVLEQRDRIADHFLSRARRARQDGSFKQALTFIESGRLFHPDSPAFDAENQSLAEAQAQLRARREAERVTALRASLKAELRSKAETNQVQEAKSLLLELRARGLADDDPFLREEAPRLLADAYARLAATRAAREDFDGAISLAEAGLRQWPEHEEIRARLAGYEIAQENQRFERALRKRLADPVTLDVSATAADLARLEARFPNRYRQMMAELAALRTLAVLDYARSAQPIADRMVEQLSAHDALFPEYRRELADQLIAIVAQRLRAQTPARVDDIEALRPVVRNLNALAASERSRLEPVIAEIIIAGFRQRAAQDPDGARQLLAAARTLLPAHESLVMASRELPMPQIELARAHLEAGALGAAVRDLDAGAREDPGHPQIEALRARLETAMGAAQQAYERYVDDVAKAEAREQRQLDQRHADIVSLWSDNPDFQRLEIPAPRKGQCHDGLAGHGARPGGSCYDLVAGRKGPEMVVVPAGNGLAGAFAIGKYEVSVSEFNHFCQASGRCSTRTGAELRLPITGISIAEAEEYARWLSAEASRQSGQPTAYRLPNAAEWMHAATANGQQPEQKFNCRVLVAGKIIAGHDLVDARSGQQNGWGLANYAGNAREWVRTGRELSVRGGAYDDPLTDCGPELDETHSGQADELTGFRLVRELG